PTTTHFPYTTLFRSRPVTSIAVTHDMKTAHKIADRVVMLCPLSRLEAGEGQILFDGPPAELEQCADQRVRQFVEGQAAERLSERSEEHTSELQSHLK